MELVQIRFARSSSWVSTYTIASISWPNTLPHSYSTPSTSWYSRWPQCFSTSPISILLSNGITDRQGPCRVRHGLSNHWTYLFASQGWLATDLIHTINTIVFTFAFTTEYHSDVKDGHLPKVRCHCWCYWLIEMALNLLLQSKLIYLCTLHWGHCSRQ